MSLHAPSHDFMFKLPRSTLSQSLPNNDVQAGPLLIGGLGVWEFVLSEKWLRLWAGPWDSLVVVTVTASRRLPAVHAYGLGIRVGIKSSTG